MKDVKINYFCCVSILSFFFLYSLKRIYFILLRINIGFLIFVFHWVMFFKKNEKRHYEWKYIFTGMYLVVFVYIYIRWICSRNLWYTSLALWKYSFSFIHLFSLHFVQVTLLFLFYKVGQKNEKWRHREAER